MNRNKFKIIYIPICLIIMIFAIAIISKITQNDLFFDLKTGESIMKHGIDFKDHFSFIPNLTYMYHHYLYDIIIYYIHQFSGYAGVLLFFTLIFTILGITIFYVNYKNTNNKIISILIALSTMWLCRGFASNRVQTITYLLFFLEIYFAEKLYSTGNKKYTIYLIIVSILIANLHMPMWILVIVFFLPFVFESVFKLLIDKWSKLKGVISKKIIIKSPKNNRQLFITFIILLFTGLITPLKFYPYTFFTKALGNSSFLFISEMKKTILINNYNELLLLGLMVVFVFILNTKVKLRDLVFLLGVSFFSLIATRNTVYIYLFFPTILSKVYFETYKISLIKLNKMNQIVSQINHNVINIFASLCLIILYIYCFVMIDFNKFDYKIADYYPDETVKYIKENLDYRNIKLYNHFNYGSYLEYNDIPVFIDSRAEVYIYDFNGGQDIVGDFLKTKEYLSYKEIFKKYEFDYALVYKDSDLFEYLNNDTDFKIIYEETKDSRQYILFECNIKTNKNKKRI